MSKVRKLFGVACGDFNLIEPNDNILIPVDRSHQLLTLAHWTRFKETKMPEKFLMKFIHVHAGEPDPATSAFLNEFCEKYKVPLIFKSVEKSHLTKEDFLTILVESAIQLGCNKVGIPDNLELLVHILFGTMAKFGEFSGRQMKQRVQIGNNEVFIIRPLCYCLMCDFTKFCEKEGYPESPTGVTWDNDEVSELGKKVFASIVDDPSDRYILSNVFKSQFQIEKHYIGAGE